MALSCCDPDLMLTATSLRRELNARAASMGAPYELTDGREPSVIFAAQDSGHHGNFFSASYRAICADPAWAKRLAKAHTGYRRARLRAAWRWRELECACSSDALLMNIFCHPGTLTSRPVRLLLGVEHDAHPSFGVRARVPLIGGRPDTTEVDMRLGSLLVEAKLTETGFQTAPPPLVTRYRDLEQVFDLNLLPRTEAVQVAEQWDEGLNAMKPVVRGRDRWFTSYQLTRGVLAAHALSAGFCLLCDARRVDLIEAWHQVQRAVREPELRTRLLLLTWQELADVLPSELRAFLAHKYGIGC